MSAGIRAILTQVFRRFTQSLLENSGQNLDYAMTICFLILITQLRGRCAV
jgi:hypothetical protein